MRYVAFIRQHDDAGFGISFPDFPGCVSDGQTVDDAIRQGCEALAGHAQGLSERGDGIPLPRSVDSIKADAALDDCREGADIAFVPLILDRGSSRRVNVSLDPGLLDAIDDEAKRRRMTRSAFLASAARRELETT